MSCSTPMLQEHGGNTTKVPSSIKLQTLSSHKQSCALPGSCLDDPRLRPHFHKGQVLEVEIGPRHKLQNQKHFCYPWYCIVFRKFSLLLRSMCQNHYLVTRNQVSCKLVEEGDQRLGVGGRQWWPRPPILLQPTTPVDCCIVPARSPSSSS
jgi:hypothetical protein